jgi:hypothetical protein
VQKRAQFLERARPWVLTEGVIPSLHIDYKNSRIKQYFKQVPEVREVGQPGPESLRAFISNVRWHPPATSPRYFPICHISFPSLPGAVSQSSYAVTNSLFYGSRA